MVQKTMRTWSGMMTAPFGVGLASEVASSMSSLSKKEVGMSRRYSMAFSIEGHKKDNVDLIIVALERIWNIDDNPLVDDERIVAFGDGSLCGGEMENEFAQRVADAVWKANEGKCRVEVNATCLEDLPSETYILGDDGEDE
jgi:hypothetical protein